MFQFNSAVFGASSRIIAGAAAAAVLSIAAPAAAGPFFVASAYWEDPGSLGDKMAPMDTIISPYNIFAADGTSADGAIDYLAFCIQLNVKMFKAGENLGGGGDVINAQFADEDLLDDGDRAAVAQLVNYGIANAALLTGIDRWDLLAKVQVAIWQVTDGTTVHFNQDIYTPTLADQYDLDAQGLYTSALAGTLVDVDDLQDIRTVYARTPAGGFGRQGLAFLGTAPVGGVPEPMSWALMIVGFFSAGALLRTTRRRSYAA